MTTTFTDLVQAQIDALAREIADAQEKRTSAQQEIARCSQIVDRNEAKLEALGVTLNAARRIEGVETGRHQPAQPSAPSTGSKSGRPKLKATEAIFDLIDRTGSASREELLALGDVIDTTADNPRHILQTTLYLLAKKRKLVEDNGRIKRPQRSEKLPAST